MRYFTKELWSKINDNDESIRTQAEKEWNTNSLTYQQQFMETRKYLSRGFAKSYLSRNGLHDYTVLGMLITKREQTYCCDLQLSNGEETVLIAMVGIKALLVDIDSFHCCVQGKLAWGYSEFEITPGNNVKLSVLCDEQNEMQFEFEKIRLIKQ